MSARTRTLAALALAVTAHAADLPGAVYALTNSPAGTVASGGVGTGAGYARVAQLGRIAVFRVTSDGSLEALPPFSGTPAGLAGLAAR